jgi:tetratricopeptide (TPR) repeat protein
MIPSTLSLLDQAELLQLAIDSNNSGAAGAAIAYLKEAVSRTDATANAHFLLGAEYAQIKLYDRAVGEMEAALALDPGLSIARLQLGLLWLTSGAVERAVQVLAPLSELGEEEPLRLFAEGLCALVRDEFDNTVRLLESGIAHNQVNDALNTDMRRLLDELAPLRAAAGQGAPEPADAEDIPHLLLSAYTGNTNH